MNYILLNAAVASKIIAFDVSLLEEIGFQLFNTLVLFWILVKLLYKPVSNFMEKRRNAIDTDITDAKKLKEEALKTKAEYEEKIQNIHKEADEILECARKKAVVNEEVIIKNAKAEASDIKKRAQSDMDLYLEQAKDSMKKEIIDVSALLTKKVIKVSIDQAKHLELIDETIEEIGDVKWLA